MKGIISRKAGRNFHLVYPGREGSLDFLKYYIIIYYNAFLFNSLITFGTFKKNLIGMVINLNILPFQSLIVIYMTRTSKLFYMGGEGGGVVKIKNRKFCLGIPKFNLGRVSIYLPLSYPFRSLISSTFI